ncbi:MAG TPA: carbohydrate kinase family protein [Nitrososphaera sp.]|nr:carbohydrate kinase family protein [Nitrososphaera sp.]
MEIIEKLRHLSTIGSIVVMHDFFVDRIIRLESKENLFGALSEKAKVGGGSVRGIPTTDVKGGNAVNVAYCLAKLGAKVSLFTVADEMGSMMIRQAFSQFGDKVTLRIANGRSGLTTCFEFPHEDTRVNVMVSDIGDNERFGPEMISSEADKTMLKNADGVMVVNWATNISGTELAEFSFKNSPSAFHFLDPADVETRKHDFRDSLAKLSGLTDCLSINENECNSLADALGFGRVLGSVYSVEEVKKAAKRISESVGISTDLHTKVGAAWSNGKESAFAHTIKVDAKRLTGAGDTWDAADIIGYLAGLHPQERLLFANCCASLYIRDPNGEPPSMNKAFELIERVL